MLYDTASRSIVIKLFGYACANADEQKRLSVIHFVRAKQNPAAVGRTADKNKSEEKLAFRKFSSVVARNHGCIA